MGMVWGADTKRFNPLFVSTFKAILPVYFKNDCPRVCRQSVLCGNVVEVPKRFVVIAQGVTEGLFTEGKL